MTASISTKGDRLHFTGLKCACGNAHQAPTQDLYIGADMALKFPGYVKKRELGRKAVLISDQAAYDAAGRALLQALRKAGFEVTLTLLSRPVADERSLGEAMLAMRMDTEFFIGAGGMEVANVTRAAAAQTERPYALLATSPSGCGFLSQEAQMALKGEAMALPAVAPELIAFDLGALQDAPPECFAEGLLDLAACHLARADWAAMKLLRDDAYCPLCADLSVQAAERAFAAIDEIAAKSEPGVRTLAESLLMAGVAAFVSGGSRPVSSAAQCLARRMALSGEADYPAALAGAVTGLLGAYRAFDPEKSACSGGDPEALGALKSRRAGLKQVLERLPSGEAVAAAVQRVAPELSFAASALEPPRADGAAACGGLWDFAKLAGCFPVS
jgi:glycerol dehydrogenase-like iron-containing ADH family enzyme